MYTSGSPKIILKTLKGLNDHLFIPAFGLERNSYSSVPNYISIFPTFYYVDRFLQSLK